MISAIKNHKVGSGIESDTGRGYLGWSNKASLRKDSFSRGMQEVRKEPWKYLMRESSKYREKISEALNWGNIGTFEKQESQCDWHQVRKRGSGRKVDGRSNLAKGQVGYYIPGKDNSFICSKTESP